MKSIINASVLAFALVAGTGQAQAEAVWHFPYKGAPYATQTEPVQHATGARHDRVVVQASKHTAGKSKFACKANVIC